MLFEMQQFLRHMYQYGLTGGVLLICSIKDMRYGLVERNIMGIYGLLLVLGHGMIKDSSMGGILLGLIPGTAALILSKISREALGYGDSLLILLMGGSLGLGDTMEVILLALFFSSMWSLFLLSVKKVNRKQEIPFVPFLLIGFAGMLMG